MKIVKIGSPPETGSVRRKNLLRAILVFVDGSSSDAIAISAATVLSTLLELEKIVLTPRDEKKVKFPLPSVLVLAAAQIHWLARLRLNGFGGGVLILSAEAGASLKAEYKILRWGEGSHDICPLPLKIEDLLVKATQLVPLEPENLTMLQSELKVSDRWMKRRVIPGLRKLQQQRGKAGEAEAIAAIAKIVEELRSRTPVTCHVVVEIGGHQAQIQEHFQNLLDKIREAPSDDDNPIKLLQETFAKWHDLVMKAGEGMGEFMG